MRVTSLSNPVGIDILVGCVAVSALGAILITLGWGGGRSWIIVVAIGVLLLPIRIHREHSLAKVRTASVASLATNATVLLIGMAVATGNLVTRPISPYDDEPAYFYLVRRLWILGDIHDPYNTRRLQSHGLSVFLQMLGMGPLTDTAFNAFDEFVGGVLILTAVLTIRGIRHRLWIAGLVMTVLSYHSDRGGGTSMTSLFFTAVYMVLIVEVFRNWDSTGSQRLHFLGIQALCVIQLTLMRSFASVVLALFVVWQIAARRVRVPRKFLLLFSLAAGGLSGPWMLLQYRDSGTPFYPIFRGVASRTFPISGDRSKVAMLPHMLRSASELLTSGALPWLCLATLLVWRATSTDDQRPRSRDRQLVFPVLVSSLVFYVLLLSFIFARWGTPMYWTRYWSPIVIAIGVGAVVLSSEALFGSSRVRLVVLAQSALIFGGYVTSPHVAATDIGSDLVKTIDGRYSKDLAVDLFEAERGRYLSVLQSIPSGSRVLSAVQLPHLLLDRDFTLNTLDFPGASVPKGEFPSKGTYTEQVDWLRSQNMDFLLVQSRSSKSTFYDYDEYTSWLDRDRADAEIAEYMIDWLEFSYTLSARNAPATTAGDLVLIDLSDLR